MDIDKGKLTIEQINQNLYSEDKVMVSAKHDIPTSTIKSIANGSRSYKSKTGKMIIGDLIALAKINIEAKVEKKKVIEAPKKEMPTEKINSDFLEDDKDDNYYRERNFDCGNDDL